MESAYVTQEHMMMDKIEHVQFVIIHAQLVMEDHIINVILANRVDL